MARTGLIFFFRGRGAILIFKALGKGSWEKRSLLKRAFIPGVSEGRMPSKSMVLERSSGGWWRIRGDRMREKSPQHRPWPIGAEDQWVVGLGKHPGREPFIGDQGCRKYR